ncbi:MULTISPECIES: alpha/beta hydrolase family protein [Chitinophagaceae]
MTSIASKRMFSAKRMGILTVANLFYLLVNAQFPIGNWRGQLQVGESALSLIFHVTSQNAVFKATMDSPNQSATDIRMDSVWVKSDSLFVVYKAADILYKGQYTTTSDSINGTFSQRGIVLALKLGRLKNVETVALTDRPQTPPYDVDYYTEEVEIPNKDAHISLVGTLTLPLKKTKPSCIILVSGSGPQNRDEEILGHKPFWVLADFLTKNGYAVLRYDDRGIAKSKGNYENATMHDFASDAYAVVEYLKTRNDIGSIGMAGHSEGGAIVQEIAAEHPKDIAYIVLLAAPALRGDSLMLLQKQAFESKLGIPKIQIAQGLQTFRGAYNIILDNPLWSHGMPKVKSYFFDILKKMNPNTSDKNVVFQQEQLTKAFTPEFYSIIRFDPVQYLPKISCPILALNGSKDIQVLPTENLSAIRALTQQNRRTTIKEFDGLNHLFQEAQTGLPNEYGKITQTFSPLAMNYILDWLKNNDL